MLQFLVIFIFLGTQSDSNTQLAESASPTTLSMQEAIQVALQRNALHQAVVEKRHEVAGGITEARSAAFPRITFKGSYSETRSPSLLNSKDFEDFVSQFPDGSFEPQVQPLHNFTVEVNQALFTWGRVKSAIELADILANQTEYSISGSGLQTAHLAAEAYLACLMTEEALEVEEGERAILQDAFELVQVRTELGQATRLDLLRAKSALAEIEPNILQKRSDVQLARRNLAQILNRTNLGNTELTGTEFQLEKAPNLDELYQIGLRTRPDLKELNIQQSSLEKQRKIQKSVGLPNLEFNGAYGRETLYFDNVTDPRYNSWRASIDLSWTLFDGFEKRGKLAQYTSQIRQVQLQEEQLNRTIQYEIEEALLNYQTDLQKLDVTQIHLETALEAVRVAEASYREGVALQNDWLDAQQEARKSRLNLVLAQFKAKQSRLRLARALGLQPLTPFPN